METGAPIGVICDNNRFKDYFPMLERTFLKRIKSNKERETLTHLYSASAALEASTCIDLHTSTCERVADRLIFSLMKPLNQ